MVDVHRAQYRGIGDPLPDLTLPRLGGGQLSLAALRGTYVLLFMWASW